MRQGRIAIRIFVSCCVVLLCLAGRAVSSAPQLSVADWLHTEAELSMTKLQRAISPVGSAPGVVIASPQRQAPDYYKHWVRDAALTMDTLFDSALYSNSTQYQDKVDSLMNQYALFSRQNQLVSTSAGLGEPVFEVNGDVFRGPWGRPQNDGPAIRAIALGKWALSLLARGGRVYVQTYLYAAEIPAKRVVKADMEYVAHHWQDSSFDLWEEVRGEHFFTLMMQRKALLIGAVLAEKMSDVGAATYYREQAQNIFVRLNSFWDGNRNHLVATINWREGVNYKGSGLDVAVLLGLLYGEVDGAFSLKDPRSLKTFDKLKSVFSKIYPINQKNPTLAPALGRYPEDRYSGSDFNGGNPWVLSTLAAAEYCYKLAGSLSQSKQPTLRAHARVAMSMGDSFVERVKFHVNDDGSLSEQIDRQTGFMTSARDLTWNYAAILRTWWAREKVRLH